jgi:hypothetical protein
MQIHSKRTKVYAFKSSFSRDVERRLKTTVFKTSKCFKNFIRK